MSVLLFQRLTLLFGRSCMSDSISKLASMIDEQIYMNVITKMHIECIRFAKVKTTHADVFELFEATIKWIAE